MRQTGVRRHYEDVQGAGGVGALDGAARRLFVALASVAAGLVIVNLAFFVVRFGLGHESLGVPQLLNLNHEENLPASLSGLMLAIVALLSLLIGLRRRSRASESVLWFVLAGGLLYFCIDELNQIHEQLSIPMRDTFGLSGIFYFGWVVPAIVVLVALLPIALKFTRRLEPRVRSLFILATILYVGGAIGVEMVGGYIAESHGFDHPWYVAAATVEETAEIAGILVLMYALFIKLHIEVAIGSPAPASPAD